MPLTKTLTLGAALGLAGAVLIAAPSHAASRNANANSGSTVQTSFDGTGVTFTCGSTVLTATSGTVNETISITYDHNNNEHTTVTLVPQSMVLTSGSSTYTVTGQSSYDAKLDTSGQVVNSTETARFDVLTSAGKVFGSVVFDQTLANGVTTTTDTGTCHTS